MTSSSLGCSFKRGRTTVELKIWYYRIALKIYFAQNYCVNLYDAIVWSSQLSGRGGVGSCISDFWLDCVWWLRLVVSFLFVFVLLVSPWFGPLAGPPWWTQRCHRDLLSEWPWRPACDPRPATMYPPTRLRSVFS